jgi:AraC-like DNA-binding protein
MRDVRTSARPGIDGRRPRSSEDAKAVLVRAHDGLSRLRSSDPDEASDILSRVYVGHRLRLPRSVKSVDMELAGFQLGKLTVGRLTYGTNVSVVTGDLDKFHLNVPVRGRTASRHGSGEAAVSTAGEPLVFSPGAPADIAWSSECVQLCLMVPREPVEAELGRLLGASVRQRLAFDFGAKLPQAVSQGWQSVLRQLVVETQEPTRMITHPHVSGHVESLVLDGLLLSQPHNYSEQVDRPARRCKSSAIQRAAELIEEFPTEPWSVVRLASEAHLSVRSLQEGFRREFDVSPMTYLKQVRLRRARAALLRPEPGSTVQSVAVSCGFLHGGRFASDYRALFGEAPSETLRRAT